MQCSESHFFLKVYHAYYQWVPLFLSVQVPGLQILTIIFKTLYQIPCSSEMKRITAYTLGVCQNGWSYRKTSLETENKELRVP